MRFPFWSNLLKELSKPEATNGQFEAAAKFANSPNFCLIGEGAGFGELGENGERSSSLHPKAKEIYYDFTGKLFIYDPTDPRFAERAARLEKAKHLLRRAQHLQYIYK